MVFTVFIPFYGFFQNKLLHFACSPVLLPLLLKTLADAAVNLHVSDASAISAICRKFLKSFRYHRMAQLSPDENDLEVSPHMK